MADPTSPTNDSSPPTHPTPPSGMPAVRESRLPRENLDEVRASKTSEAPEILAAVQSLRDDVSGRLTQIENQLEIQGKALFTLGTEVGQHRSQIAELASAQVSSAKAAAAAADIAAHALKTAHSSQDETTKMVQSAMEIQKGAIESAVQNAVDTSTKPLSEAVGEIINELGVEDRVTLGRDVKPNEKRQKPTLQKLDARAARSSIVQIIIALGFIASLLERALSHH